MTLDEALACRVGDHVLHKATLIRDQPIRITAMWVNDKKTIVRVRLAAIDPSQWLDLTGYTLPPAGKMWDRAFQDWVTRAEYKKRHAPDPQRWSRPHAMVE